MTLHTQKEMTRITENHPSSVRKVADLQESFWQSSLPIAWDGYIYHKNPPFIWSIYHTWMVWAIPHFCKYIKASSLRTFNTATTTRQLSTTLGNRLSMFVGNQNILQFQISVDNIPIVPGHKDF